MAEPIRFNRRALLNFFNEGLTEANGHHTAVTGLLGEPLAVALILHYLKRNGDSARLVSMKVTTGHLKGHRLDAWIDNGQGTLYQTEIKMWAGNAFGGLRLKPDADETVLLQGGNRQWKRIWDAEKRDFLSPVVGKVLTPMRRPPGYEEAHVESLACFWWMVQPPGGSPPWFTVETSNLDFPEIHIFSLTAYLLSLPDDELNLDMPLLTQRMNLLDSLIIR